MPEDFTLAPDWVQEEFHREPEELRRWLEEQRSLPNGGDDVRPGKGRRRVRQGG